MYNNQDGTCVAKPKCPKARCLGYQPSNKLCYQYTALVNETYSNYFDYYGGSRNGNFSACPNAGTYCTYNANENPSAAYCTDLLPINAACKYSYEC